ncbi:MAG: hypothetical protein ACLSH6_10440 [Limosilactobacillus pontis]
MNDQYVWQPVQAGQPDRILNCPVYTVPTCLTWLLEINRPLRRFNYY